ncbi:hypothetical protein UFOVP221_16 [uncultured Caudovirales phage]|uniref:Uncharacterized protein n=1 Tax=uncultured Caudovirales phage TaxID=2100421 RepID=A0A6J7WQM1_9CAUD|nr:hypothetical protein UFOVP221_16 [uncultured Caudovirales phage]
MASTLTAYNRLTYMTSSTEEEAIRWLDTHKIVDFDSIIDKSVDLIDVPLGQRQLTFARAQGRVELFITGDPKMWVYAFEQGIPSVLFGHPDYSRAEFRPDAPKRVRSWDDIQEAIDKQNTIRTQDLRLTRTESLNFE